MALCHFLLISHWLRCCRTYCGWRGLAAWQGNIKQASLCVFGFSGLTTSIVPAYSSIMFRVSARPSPVPWLSSLVVKKEYLYR